MGSLYGDLVVVEGAVTLSFNSGDLVNDNTVLAMDLMDGWKNSAKPKPILSSYGASDGALSASRFPLAEKYMTLSGYVRSTREDALDAERVRDDLNTLFDERTSLTLTRYGVTPRYMTVRAYEEVDYPADEDLGWAFRWTVGLVADWPFKRDPSARNINAEFAATTGGDYFRTYPRVYPLVYQKQASGQPTRLDSWSFTNSGNALAYPTLEVHGPAPADSWFFQEINTGRIMSFSVDVPDGQVLYIDTFNKSAFLGGVPVDYFLSGEWLALEPRSQSIIKLFTSIPGSAAYAVGHAESTWR